MVAVVVVRLAVSMFGIVVGVAVVGLGSGSGIRCLAVGSPLVWWASNTGIAFALAARTCSRRYFVVDAAGFAVVGFAVAGLLYVVVVD